MKRIIETSEGYFLLESTELLLHVDTWGVVPGYSLAAQLISNIKKKKVSESRVEIAVESGEEVAGIKVRPATRAEVRAQYKRVPIVKDDDFAYGNKRCPVTVRYQMSWGREDAHLPSMTRAQNGLGVSRQVLTKIGNKLPGYKKTMRLLPDNVTSVIVNDPGWEPKGGWESYNSIDEDQLKPMGKAKKLANGKIRVRIPEQVLEYDDFREIPKDLLHVIE